MGIKQSSAFLWEDLGLDIYKNIDEGLYNLELKQYEYEMTWQWETSVGEVVNGILESDGLKCDISSTADIERIISGSDQTKFIVDRCSRDGESMTSAQVQVIVSKMTHIRDSFKNRAVEKSQKTYEVARIGLYSDGIEENSPFDLIVDLQEIDKVIFGEEIDYEWEEWQWDGDDLLDDFLEEDKEYLYEEEDEEDEEDEEGTEEDEEITGSGSTSDDEDTTTEDEDTPTHRYFCVDPLTESGFGTGSLDDIDDIIDLDSLVDDDTDDDEIVVIGTDTPITDDRYTNYASWGGPFRWWPPNGAFASTTDQWNCDSFFCITIEFVMTNHNLLGWWESLSIQKVLTRVAEHMDKFANTSLVQSKMTTNNFELGLIIPNLGDLLRGLWIQVQTKPAPILNNIEQSEDKKDNIEWDMFTAENLLQRYYKNLWQDYERRNDMDILTDRTYERKVFEESGWLPTLFPGRKLEELEKFNTALAESNRIVSLGIDSKSTEEDLKDFYDQFVELERFVGTIEDFCTSMAGIIKKMKNIPTRSS